MSEPLGQRGWRGRVRPVSVQRTAASMEPFDPLDVAEVEGVALRVVRFDGTNAWHRHPYDELFLCWDGGFVVELADGAPVPLGPGDLAVVPAGRRHRTIAARPATAVLVERVSDGPRG